MRSYCDYLCLEKAILQRYSSGGSQHPVGNSSGWIGTNLFTISCNAIIVVILQVDLLIMMEIRHRNHQKCLERSSLLDNDSIIA